MSDVTVAWSPSSFGVADDEPLRLLERAGVTVRPNSLGRRLTEDEAIGHLDGVDGLIAGLEPLSRKVLVSARRLRAIARVGIGMDNIDLGVAQELGIRVSNTPDAPTESVAELTLTAGLALLRGIRQMDRAVHQGEWVKQLTPGLLGAPVLLIGFGRIGRAVARRFQASGANVMVTDPDFSPEPGLDVEPVPLRDGLSRARVVSLHASGRRCLLGSEELGWLRKGAVLLNGARGELVDEQALMHALDVGQVGGAWLDVFQEEPYHGPLTAYDQVLLTPHAGSYTFACRRAMELEATRNVLSDLEIVVPS